MALSPQYRCTTLRVEVAARKEFHHEVGLQARFVIVQ